MNYFLAVALFANLMNFYHFGFAAMPPGQKNPVNSPKYRFLQYEFFVYKCQDLAGNDELRRQLNHNIISFVVGNIFQIQNILF